MPVKQTKAMGAFHRLFTNHINKWMWNIQGLMYIFLAILLDDEVFMMYD